MADSGFTGKDFWEYLYNRATGSTDLAENFCVHLELALEDNCPNLYKINEGYVVQHVLDYLKDLHVLWIDDEQLASRLMKLLTRIEEALPSSLAEDGEDEEGRVRYLPRFTDDWRFSNDLSFKKCN